MYNQNRNSKAGVGIVLGLFLGIIGLVIGLLLYPANSYERETFISAWGKTFFITMIIGIILAASIYSNMLSLFSSFI